MARLRKEVLMDEMAPYKLRIKSRDEKKIIKSHYFYSAEALTDKVNELGSTLDFDKYCMILDVPHG